MCGVSPPRCEIQRRTGDGYIEYSIWVASGLVTARAIGAEIPRRVKSQIGMRRHADLVVGNRAQHDGAGRRTQTVNDDRLARAAQALIFVDIGANPATAVLGNPNHGVARAHSCHQKNRREQPGHELHFKPQSTEPESDRPE